MVRIGVVSVLYIVPASTLIACLVYEQAYRDTWEQNFICSACRRANVDELQLSQTRLMLSAR